MDYEEDDDVHFAKWMSSYWGHSGVEDGGHDGRGSRKRQTRLIDERRASLPCPAQLSAMHMARVHTGSKSPSPLYLKGRNGIHEEKDLKVKRPEMPRKMSSPDESRQDVASPKRRSNSIQEFSEYFERHLRFRSRKSTSLVGSLKVKPALDP